MIAKPLFKKLISVAGETIAGPKSRGVSRAIRDNAARYQACKGIAFFGHIAAIVFAALVFSDKLGGFTVAFGVAGAVIAFASQEVIASVAGWVAVTFGGFYRVGIAAATLNIEKHAPIEVRLTRPAPE